MGNLRLGSVRDIEIFGFSLKRAIKVAVAAGVVVLGVSLVSTLFGLVLLPLKLLTYAVFFPVSAVAWLLGINLPGFVSFALWGVAAYGLWKYLRK